MTGAAPPGGEFGAGGQSRWSWLSRMEAAVAFTSKRRDAWLVALGGFLVRGGVVALVLPIVVLPSPIGVVSFVGLDPLNIAEQPTAWLYLAIGLAVGLVIAWLLAAGAIGSAVDIWLVREALRSGVGAHPATPARVFSRRSHSDRSLIVQLMAIRGFLFVPLAAMVGLAGVVIGVKTYNESLIPTDLATPLILRVLGGTFPAVAGILVVWTLTETLGAIAVRRQIVLRRGVLPSLLGAIGDAVRRPLTTAATAAGAFLLSAISLVVSIGALYLAFDACRAAARNYAVATSSILPEAGGPQRSGDALATLAVLVAAVAMLAAVWLMSLAASGVASTLRSAAFTRESAAGQQLAVEEPGLSTDDA